MKSSNKMASDFFKVVLSNATVLASSIITALIIPKLMGASNYRSLERLNVGCQSKYAGAY